MWTTATINDWLDRLVPDSFCLRGGAELLRARTLVAFVGAMSIVGLIFLPLIFGTGSTGLMWITLYSSVANALLLILFWKTESVPIVGHFFAANLLAEVALGVPPMGGFSLVSLVWVVLVPIVVTLLIGGHAGRIWTAVACLMVLGFYFAKQQGLTFPAGLSPQELQQVELASLLTMPVLVLALCNCYEWIRVHAETVAQQEQEMIRTVFDVQEIDRRLFAFEIHDAVIPLLTGAAMRLDATLESGADQPAEAELREIRTLLGRSLTEARQIISGLRPPILDELGIVPSIEYLASDYRKRLGLEVSVHTEGATIRFAPAIENSLFRICQEALTNIARHSGATAGFVDLRLTGRLLRLSIWDQGKGFDLDTIGSRRFGLRGIRERARLLGGTSEVVSEPGQGALIRVTLPV